MMNFESILVYKNSIALSFVICVIFNRHVAHMHMAHIDIDASIDDTTSWPAMASKGLLNREKNDIED